jgi:hypothetical protein
MASELPKTELSLWRSDAIVLFAWLMTVARLGRSCCASR